MKLKYDTEKEEFIITSGDTIEYNQLKIWLTRYPKGYKYSPAYKRGVWNGKQSFFKNGKIDLGLWGEIIKACKEIGTNLIIENKEELPINREITLESVKSFCEEYFKNHKIKNNNGDWVPFIPFDHQIETAYKILKYRYCIAEVATSGGKSLIISIIIFYTLKNINPNAKFLIIVPSINLVTQFYDNIIEYNYGLNNLENANKNNKIDFTSLNDKNAYCDIRIEEIMSDNPRKYADSKEPNIYIGTYQSLEKYPKEFFKQFYAVIADEAHKVKARTLTKILKRTFKSSHYRFGLSGTFPPDESCEILTIQSVLGPKITEITAYELKEKGIISNFEIKTVILNHNDEEMLEKINLIRRSRRGKLAFDIEKEYVQNSEKRTNFIKKIIEKCQNNTLVLFHSIEYGKKLYEKFKNEIKDKEFYYIDGNVNNKKREEIKNEMEKTDGKVKVLIASYGTLSTGISIRAIFNVIFTESFKSEFVIIQSIGRALRLHDKKEKAIIFDIVDVFSPYKMKNILFYHYLEREKYYIKRKYPFKKIKINL